MKKFYNNPAWHRIRGLRGFGILALSVAFCFTGLLALSSCDLEFWEDDDEVEVEAMEMRGFFTSADENGDTVCSNEDVDVYLEGDESTGRLDVTVVSAGAEFGKAQFKHVGQKIIDGEGNKTIVTAYVTDDEGFAHPGSYYLASTTDDNIADGETIFTGYWVGHLYRGDHSVVLCPYVLVPRTALDREGCTTTMDVTIVPMELQAYLTKNDGMDLRACSNVFDSDGKVDPQPRM